MSDSFTTSDDYDSNEFDGADGVPENAVDDAVGTDYSEEYDGDGTQDIEPGAEGPVGTGIEGADDALLTDDGDDSTEDAADIADDFNSDDSTAAEQGNRVGDEMVSEGDDDNEIAELDGDTRDVDALADDGIEEVSRVDGLDEAIDDSHQG